MKYVDTDVLVYWALDHPDHGEAATRLLRHIEVNEKGCTSALSLYLFDNILTDLGVDGYDLERFLDELARLRNLRIEPVTEKHYARAGTIRRELGVPLDVAIGLVTAQDKKADAVYSNQAAWEKGPLPRRFREA